jgi:hypothetical protein
MTMTAMIQFQGKKIPDRDSEGVWGQDKLVGGKSSVVK